MKRIHYCSPVSGEVVCDPGAEKRAIDEVVILADSDIRYIAPRSRLTNT